MIIVPTHTKLLEFDLELHLHDGTLIHVCCAIHGCSVQLTDSRSYENP